MKDQELQEITYSQYQEALEEAIESMGRIILDRKASAVSVELTDMMLEDGREVKVYLQIEELNAMSKLRREVSKRELIFEDINQERIRQDVKFGEQNHDPFKWCAILGEEVGEVNKAVIEAHFNSKSNTLLEYREELIQVAAVAISMIESLERNELKQS